MDTFSQDGILYTLFAITVIFIFRFFLTRYWTKLRLKRKIKIGDTIFWSNGFTTVGGVVVEKKLSHTLVSVSGEEGLVAIPNSFFANNPIQVISDFPE